MAYSYQEEVSNGVRTLYPVEFDFINQGDVYVYTGEHTDYTNQVSYRWADANTVELLNVIVDVPAGTKFHIRRVTRREELLHKFATASIHGEAIDEVNLQCLHLIQEAADGFQVLEGRNLSQADLDMLGNQILNCTRLAGLDRAVEGDEAVSLDTLREYLYNLEAGLGHSDYGTITSGAHLQLRRGTSEENSTFTGKAGEPVYLRDEKCLAIHDNATQGGHVQASRAYVDTVQNDIVGGTIFKGQNGKAVEVGDVVTAGSTHLRVLVGGKPAIFAMSPVAQGVVTALTGTGATIGESAVDFQPTIKLAPLKRITDRGSLSGQVVEGQRIEWQGYYSQADGGSNWGVVKFGLHVEDGFSVFSIDANTYIEANLKGKSLNIRKAGARGNKVTDDTARINIVKDYAEANIAGRFDSGQCIRVPVGDFLISAAKGTDCIRVVSSRILIQGYGPEVSVLYAPDCDFTMVHLDGSAKSLYGTSIRGIRFNTPGNATGIHLKTTRLIDSNNDNLQFVGHYDGLVSDGCARTYFTNAIFTQDTRAPNTAPRYAMDFRSDVGNNSDVHVSVWQIFMPDNRKTAASVSIRGADGIYFNNGHQQGGVIVQPGGHGLDVCATVIWDQVYFDKADAENVIFTGKSAAYRNFEFGQCYMRGSQKGLVFDTTGPIEDIRWNGGRCANHTSNGIEMKNDFVSGMVVNGVTMDGNCTSNNLGDSDILVRGDSHVFSAIVFRGGASNCRGLNLTNESSNCVSSGLDFTDSVQGIRYIDSGTDNKVGVLSGVTLKNKGTVSIPAGVSVVTVPHGMSVTPEIDSIFLQQRTTIAPATNAWVANATSTSFDVHLDAAATDNAVLSWLCDMTD